MPAVPLSEEDKIAAVNRVIAFVEHRFESTEAANLWVTSGHMPGYGQATPLDLISEGREDWIYEAVRAIEAGVYA